MTGPLLSPAVSSPGLRPQEEFQLLCALAGGQLSPARVERVANWNLSALDWVEFIRLAEKHGVLPLAARNLIESAHALPAEVDRSLRSAYESNLRRNLWFAAELARILQVFERAEIPMVPYKGPALAELVYGDLGLRYFSDLDFLIAPADFARAEHALAEIGYRPTVEIEPAVERLWLRTGYERSFDSPAGKHLVELQWALLPHFYAVDLRMEDLLARSGQAVLGDRELPCLSPEDSLLALCLHAAKHLWTRLIWLADIAETLRTQTIDYSLVLSRAHSLGMVRILAVSFWLAKNALGAELPSFCRNLIAADSRVPIVGREFAERLALGADYDFESTKYFRRILQLRERRCDRWRFVWRLLWTPGAGDITAVRLPEPLFPLYRVVRMFRLMRKL